MAEYKRKYGDLFNVRDKVIVYTGATGLIGKALSKGLAESGAKLVIIDVDHEKSREFARSLKEKFGTDALGIGVDISNRKEVQDAKEKVMEKFGRIDALVNGAQNKTANFFQSFEKYSDQDWDDVMRVNINGVYLCSQIFGEEMVKNKKGNIVNFASTYGVVSPDPNIYVGTDMGCPVAYSTSKGGVVMFTKQLAVYWSEHNIRVNAITPHGVHNNHQKRFVDNFSARSPMRRMSEPEELIGPLLFLLSEASSYVTGHNLMVDGGWSVI